MEPIKDYYEYLKKAGADIAPTFDSFKNTLSNVDTAKQYYSYLRENKFDSPDTFDSFSETLGIGKKKNGTTPSKVSPSPSPFVSETPQQKSQRHSNTAKSDAASLVTNYQSGLDQALQKRDQFGMIDMFSANQFAQSREGKAGKIVQDFQQTGTVKKEDVKYLNQVAPKAAAQIVFAGTPQDVKSKIEKTGKVDDKDIESFDLNHKTIVGDALLQNTAKSYKDFNNQQIAVLNTIPGFNPNMAADPASLDAFYKNLNAQKSKEIAAIEAKFPEKVVPSGIASVTYRENDKEYKANLKAIQERYSKVYDAIGRVAASRISSADKDPLEIGLAYLKYADPDKFALRNIAGRSSADRDIAGIGNQLQIANAKDLNSIKSAKQLSETLDNRFPEKIVADTKRRLGAELYKGDNWFANLTPSIERLDKAAEQLPQANRDAYYKFVRPVEERIVGTDIPQSGALNQFGSGIMSTVEGTNNFLSRMIGQRTEADVAKAALDAPYKTRFEAVGAGPQKARLNELVKKEKSGSTLSTQEREEKADLETYTNVRSTTREIIDGSLNLAGQVVFQALGTKGLTGLGSAAVRSAGLLKAPVAAGLATEDLIAASAMDFGITVPQIANVAGAMVAYASSYDQAEQEGMQLYPNDPTKRKLYAKSVASLNALTERIFKDEKILDAFSREVRPKVGALVSQIASGSLTREALQPTIKTIVKDGFKVLGMTQVENLKETTEEVATSIGTDLTKMILSPDKFDPNQMSENVASTATTMFVDGQLVALFAGVKNFRANKVGINMLSKIGTDKSFTADVKSVINAQVLSGELTNAQGKEKLNVVNTIESVNAVDMPKVNAVTKLSDSANKKYAVALANEKLLKQQLDSSQDEALKTTIQDQIKSSEDFRKSILNKEIFIDDNFNVNTGDSNIAPSSTNLSPELSIIESLSPDQIEVSEDSTEFANQMTAAQSSLGKAGMSVSPYPQEDYDDIASKGGQFLRAAGNKILALLKPNGEMVSLVKDATVKTKGAAQAMISKMKDMGGLFMDNYDIYLTPIYEKAGYKVVARVPFNEEYAPEGWDAEDSPLKNKPDVVFMVRNDLAQDQAQTFQDYGDAQAFTQRLVDKAVGDGTAKLPTQVVPINKALEAAIPNATKALEKANIKFQVVDGATDTESAKAARGNQGLFVAADGTIFIDKSKLQDEIEAGLVVWHEASHPVMNIIRNTNKPLYDAMVRGLAKAAKKNAGVAGALNWAKSQKEYKTEDVQNDEAIVETIGRINSGLIDVSKLDTGLRQQIIDFVNSIAKFFGIDPILNDTDLAAFKKTVSQVADALKTGRDISEVVGAENIKKFDAKSPQSRADSKKVAQDTEDRVIESATQPSMVLVGKKKGEDVILYSGPASIESLRELKPKMYVSRAEDLAESHLVPGKVRSYNSNATQEQKLKWADKVYEQAKATVISNLNYIFDQIPESIRNISKLWYDGANIISQELANKYGTTIEQAAAVIATQSPQKPWYDNVHLAHFIMDFYATKKNEVFTREMFDYFELKSQPSKENPKGYPKQQQYLPTLEKAIGKKFSELSNYDKSVMIRSEFDNKYERTAPLRVPTGDIVGRVSDMSSFSGYDTIAKGVSILEDGGEENISKNLGKAFKVRNFNNNISNPKMEGEVTIDTHAIAAAYMLPLGSSSDEVNFDAGTYAFFADAYRESARQKGVLARELQSIVWEGARALFPDTAKEESDKAKARAIWSNYKDGSLPLSNVQEQIKNNGKDLSNTDWARFSDTIFKGDGQRNYLEELPLAGRNKSATESGDGGIDSRGLSGMGRGGNATDQASVGNRNLAPNGKPSNLNAKQYEQVRTPEFKNWFGDWENDPKNASKVVDENGEPLVVYHNSLFKNIEEFKGYVTYFTDNKEYAKTFKGIEFPNETQYEAYLNIRNPYNSVKPIADVPEEVFREGNVVAPRLVKKYFGSAIDGLIGVDAGQTEGKTYVSFNPNQIKSATGNTGAFSTTDNRIQASVGNREVFNKELPDSIINSVRASLRKKAPDSTTLQYLDELQQAKKDDNLLFEGPVNDMLENGVTLNDIASMLLDDEVFEDVRQVRNYFNNIGGPDGVGILTKASQASVGNRGEMINWEKLKPGKGDPKISSRNPIVTQAAADLKAGKITNEEYRAVASENNPIRPITRFFEPATKSEVYNSLSSDKLDKIDTPIQDGSPVGIRLDIPAFKNNNTWVVSVHEGNTNAGKSISYSNVARITDVNFGLEPKAGLKIAAGESKSTIGRIFGKWQNLDGDNMKDKGDTAKQIIQDTVGNPDWVQVGFNPFRHSYFYDRSSDMGRPIVSADEVVQIGGLVYAKKPTYGNWTDESYRVKGMFDKAGAPVQFSVGNRDIINGFYSPIEDRINTFKQPKASVQKWKEIVGVKSDEAVFSGLADWLGGMKPDRQLSKEEVSQFIKDNRIEIKEVVKGDEKFSFSDDNLKEMNNLIRGNDLLGFETIAEAREAIRDDADFARNWDIQDQRLITLGNEYRNSVKNFRQDATKYFQYQLPGGENYKEVLITLPKADPFIISKTRGFDTLNYTKNTYGVKSGEYATTKRSVVEELEEKGLEYPLIKQLFDNYESQAAEFKSSHFNEPNIITHLRMNTRTDADGKKVLFLEEVQSDWGQKGKREGFATNPNEQKQLSDIRDRMYKLSIEQESLFETKKIGNTGTISDFQQTIKNKSRYDEIEKELNSLRIEEQKINKGDVALAPYVTNTNAWVKLGLKVALKEAVKQGADRIAWTTGEQQSDRFNLSKTIESIKAIRKGVPYFGGKRPANLPRYYTLKIKYKNGEEGQTDMADSELADAVGKDLADKIIADNGGVYSGLDLQVGGKGMKAFYGDAKTPGIVGNVAKALVKELTGKEAVLNTSSIDTKTIKSNIDLGDGWETGTSKDSLTIQPAIDITPELKTSVQGGMPQFSVGNRSEEDLRAGGTGKERKRALSSRFGDLDPETQAKIQDDATTYFQRPNKQTATAVNEFLDGLDIIDAADYILGNPDIPEVSKVWMAAEIAKRLSPQIDAATDPATKEALTNKQSSIYNEFAKKATDLGQAVQAFIAFKKDPNAVEFFLPKMLAELKKKGAENITDIQKAEIATLLKEVSNAPEGLPKDKAIIKLSHYLGNIVPMKPMSVLQALWYAKILSGVTTQATNFFANIFNTAFELPAVSLRIAIKNGNPMALLAGIKGFGSGVAKGAVTAADIFKSGVRSKEVDKYFAESPLEYFTWSKWLGKTGKVMDNIPPINFGAWKYVGRLLAATDALFSTANQEAIANMLAYAEAAGTPAGNNFKKANEILGNTKMSVLRAKAQAKAEGFDINTVQGRRRVIEIVSQKRGEKITSEADAIGKRITMNYDPEGWTKPLFDATVALQQKIPAIKMVIPFARIVANLTENALNYSPFGLAKAATGIKNPFSGLKSDRLTGDERADMFLKFAIGMGTLAFAATKVGDDDDDWFEITASGTPDVQKKYELQKGGWRPYTITFKDGTKISYKDWPIAGMLAGLGHIRDSKKYSYDDTNAMTLAAYGFFLNMYDKSLLSGLSDFFGLVHPTAGRGKYAPDSKASERMQKYAAQQVKSVAISNLAQQTGRLYSELITGDPQRDARTFMEVIYKDLPIVNDGIRPIIDVFGDPVKYNTTERMKPIYTTESEEMIKWLNENKLFVGVPQRKNMYTADGEQRPMTDDEYYEYRKLAGKGTRDMIKEFMEGIKYPDRQISEKMFDGAKDAARNIAYVTMLEKYGFK